MRLNNIKSFPQTIHDYSSVNITQIFASEDKTRSLSVQFIAPNQMFFVTDIETKQLRKNLIFMKLENIKELLQIICNFNNPTLLVPLQLKEAMRR